MAFSAGERMRLSEDKIYSAIVLGNASDTREAVTEALDRGLAASDILKLSMIPAMGRVGLRFEAGEYYIPEMMIAARAMQDGLNMLRPRLVAEGAKPIGKVALATMKGDLHDLGKNLVGMILEGAGFEVLDLGVDVALSRIVQPVSDGAMALGMSALLTTTMPVMGEIIRALEEAGLREQVKIIVGGASVTERFARKVGADAFGPDAASAPRILKGLLGLGDG